MEEVSVLVSSWHKIWSLQGLCFLRQHCPASPSLVPREVIDGHRVAWEGGQEILLGWREGDLTAFVEGGTQESQ